MTAFIIGAIAFTIMSCYLNYVRNRKYTQHNIQQQNIQPEIIQEEPVQTLEPIYTEKPIIEKHPINPDDPDFEVKGVRIGDTVYNEVVRKPAKKKYDLDVVHSKLCGTLIYPIEDTNKPIELRFLEEVIANTNVIFNPNDKTVTYQTIRHKELYNVNYGDVSYTIDEIWVNAGYTEEEFEYRCIIEDDKFKIELSDEDYEKVLLAFLQNRLKTAFCLVNTESDSGFVVLIQTNLEYEVPDLSTSFLKMRQYKEKYTKHLNAKETKKFEQYIENYSNKNGTLNKETCEDKMFKWENSRYPLQKHFSNMIEEIKKNDPQLLQSAAYLTRFYV